MSDSSSLFALYRRGRRYRDPATTLENPEVEKSREERERFIAAALALCLRCDAGFRERFWLNVCHVSDDPDSPPPIRAEDILLEPPHWADLRLISDTPSGRYIWVIEIKTGQPFTSIPLLWKLQNQFMSEPALLELETP